MVEQTLLVCHPFFQTHIEIFHLNQKLVFYGFHNLSQKSFLQKFEDFVVH